MRAEMLDVKVEATSAMTRITRPTGPQAGRKRGQRERAVKRTGDER